MMPFEQQNGELVRLYLVLAIALASTSFASAVERPSFMQQGDAFCTNEDDFNGFATTGQRRVNSATESCRTIARPTRVAIIGGAGGVKTMVRIMSGANAFQVGWTNGKLPTQ